MRTCVQHRVAFHRVVVEAHLSGLPTDEFIARIRAGALQGLTFLGRRVHVHHRDEDPKNNDLSNLEVLKIADHIREHVVPERVLWGSSFERVTDIRSVGADQTYDLSIAEPYPHNYTANGFVVHNSGKTTLVRKVLDRTGIALCAPTNKAARRLAQVTGKATTTVHSLIYGTAREEWVKPDDTVCTGFLSEVELPDGTTLEVLNPAPGCPGCQCRSELRFGAPKEMDEARLVIVDEASMIGSELAADIRHAVAKHTRGAQILWVGDPAQLPPVKDTPGVNLHAPDVMLTKVWRADGGILKIATDIRHAETPDAIEAILQRAAAGEYPDVAVLRGGEAAIAEWRAGHEYRMVVTHMNKDRQGVNKAVRALLAPRRARAGRSGMLCAGDRLLIRQNVRDELGVITMMNSEVYALTEAQPIDGFYAVTGRLDGEPDSPDRSFVVHSAFLAEHGNDPFGRAARALRAELRPHTGRCNACRCVDTAFCGECGEVARPMEGDRIWCEYCGGPRDGSWEREACYCGPMAGLPLVNAQYGYAITAHAAQGSEAQEVGVYWTPWSHRRDFEAGRAWLYTAVTRAQSALRIWR